MVVQKLRQVAEFLLRPGFLNDLRRKTTFLDLRLSALSALLHQFVLLQLASLFIPLLQCFGVLRMLVAYSPGCEHLPLVLLNETRRHLELIVQRVDAALAVVVPHVVAALLRHISGRDP